MHGTFKLTHKDVFAFDNHRSISVVRFLRQTKPFDCSCVVEPTVRFEALGSPDAENEL